MEQEIYLSSFVNVPFENQNLDLLSNFSDFQNLDNKLKDLLIREATIKNNLRNTSNDFLGVGRELENISRNNAYKQFFKTFEDYCEKRLNISRFTAYRFMQVYQFVATSQQKNLEQFSFSQLCELVTIKHQSWLEKFTPDMTISQMRKLKKEYADFVKRENTAEICLTPQQETIITAFNEACEILEKEEKSLVLKNKAERQEFLDNFKKWQLVAYVEPIHLQIYSFEFKNGASLWAFHVTDSFFKSVQYRLCEKNSCFGLWWDTESEIINWLTRNKKEIE